MKEIYLDESTNDIVIEKGNITLSKTNLKSLRQRIYITLNAWVGEWKLNATFGMPYRQSIFVTGIDKQTIDALFVNKINSFSDVTVILSFESEFDRAKRVYTITRLVVQTQEGIQTVATRYVPDENTIYEPTSITPAGNICGDLVDQSNKFHQFLHFDLVGLWD